MEKVKVFLFFKVHFVSVVGKFKRSIVTDTGIVFKMPYHLYLALCLPCKFPLLKEKTIFDFVSWKKELSLDVLCLSEAQIEQIFQHIPDYSKYSFQLFRRK